MKYVGSPQNPVGGQDRRTYSVGDGNATNGQTVFDINYQNGRVDVFLNGVKLVYSNDYSIDSSTYSRFIQLNTGIGSSDVLFLVGYTGLNGDTLTATNFTVGTAVGAYTGSTTVFPTTASVGDKVNFYLNGVLLDEVDGDYTVSHSGGTITLATAANTGDSVEIHNIGAVAYTVTTGFTGADGTNAGTSGLVPQPAADENDKYLRGDGTWSTSTVEDTSFINAIIFG